jgi:hypothetical protein
VEFRKDNPADGKSLTRDTSESTWTVNENTIGVNDIEHSAQFAAVSAVVYKADTSDLEIFLEGLFKKSKIS